VFMNESLQGRPGGVPEILILQSANEYESRVSSTRYRRPSRYLLTFSDKLGIFALAGYQVSP